MLTNQEKNVVSFLSNKEKVFWEELASFCKEPSKVKLKTVKKIVSDIKKKYRDNSLNVPFNCEFSSLQENNTDIDKLVPTPEPKKEEAVIFNGQRLVKLERPQRPVEAKKQCLIDFTIKKYQTQIICKNGIFNVSDEEFQVFEYFYNNPEKIITLEEFRDQVVFPKFGSKLPPKWFYAIQRRINNLRRQIPDLKNRILTVKVDAFTTGYLFR